MAIQSDVGSGAATTAELQCVSVVCSTPRFIYSAAGVLGLLPWFRPTRPHSTQSTAPIPPDQISQAYSNAAPEYHPPGPESEPPAPRWPKEPSEDTIQKLMSSPALFDPLRTPRYPIVLCHGGYSTLLLVVAPRVNWEPSRIIWV